MEEGLKRKIFYIFIIINAILWSLLQSVRSVMSIDSMEAISWGELISFGTNKHPPLTGWLAAPFYNLSGHHDIAIYILGQICILVGFIYIYKLSKNFLNEEKAICSVLILQSCYYYTYNIFIDNFNCNIILLGLWPMIAYYFYQSIKLNKLKDWFLFGLFSGLAFLGKYQIAFFLLSLFVYILIADRKQFCKKGIWIAFITGILVISPHIIWVYNHDFFCLAYMINRAESDVVEISILQNVFNRLLYPLKFYADQILAVLGCVGMFIITALQTKEKITLNKITDNTDKIFLLSIFFIPIISLGLLGTITGNRVPGIWGSTMAGYTGLILFYFFNVKFNVDTFKFFVKLSAIVLAGSIIAVFVFWTVQTKRYISIPIDKITSDINAEWAKETNNAPLKYVGGDLRYSFVYRYYNPVKPHTILETFGYKNPWEDHTDILNSGAIILTTKAEDLESKTKEFIILLPKDYQINQQEYTYNICNKFKSCEEDTLYYTIIPPQND